MTTEKAIVTMVVALSVLAAPVDAQVVSSNAALRYWMAFAVLREPSVDSATAELLENVASGKAPWDETRLGSIVDANREAVETMQRGTSLPTCDWGVEYDRGPGAPIAHLAKARVLARLNTLAGMRLAANGQLSQAIDTWVTGVRFSQHVAQGGSLISLLTGRAALSSNLHALSHIPASASLDDTDRKRIDAAVRSLPDTGFDWSDAVRREESALEIFGRQVSVAPDPKAYYQRTTGQPAPENFTLPRMADVEALRRFMTRAIEVLRLPPDVASPRLKELQAIEQTLHPFFQRIPSLSRINDTRAEVRADLKRMLDIVATPPRR